MHLLEPCSCPPVLLRPVRVVMPQGRPPLDSPALGVQTTAPARDHALEEGRRSTWVGDLSMVALLVVCLLLLQWL